MIVYQTISAFICFLFFLLNILGVRFEGLKAFFLLSLFNLTIAFLISGIKDLLSNVSIRNKLVNVGLKFSLASGVISFILFFINIEGTLISRLLTIPIVLCLLFLIYLIIKKKNTYSKFYIITLFIIAIITSVLNFGNIRNGFVRAFMKRIYSSYEVTSNNLEMWDYGLKSQECFNNNNCLLGSQYADSSEVYLKKWLKYPDSIPFDIKKRNNLVYDFIFENNNCLGKQKFKDKEYTLALKYFKKAEKAVIIREENKNWRASRAILYSNIARVYSEIDSFNLADNYFGKALSVFKKFEDSTNVYKSDVHFQIGKFLNTYQDYDNSIYHYRKSIEILKLDNNFLEYKTRLINSVNRVTLVLQSINSSIEVVEVSNEILSYKELKTSHNFNYCLQFYFKSLANFNLNKFQESKDNIREAKLCLGSDKYNEDIAIQILFNIHKSKIYRQLNEFQLSEINILKALELIKLKYPEKLNYKFMALVEFASLKKYLGLINDANDLYLEAFKISEYSDLIDKAEAPNVLSEIAKIQIDLENYSKGLNYYNKAKNTSNDYLDMDSKSNSYLINNFAYIEYALNNYKQSDSLYNKILDLNKVDSDKLISSVSNNGLGLLSLRNSNFKKGDSLFNISIKASKSIYKNGSQQTSTVLFNKSESLISQKKYKEATESLNEGKQILDKIFNGKHLDYGKYYTLIGDIFFKTKKKDEALANYKKAFSIYIDVYPEAHSIIKYLLNRI